MVISVLLTSFNREQKTLACLRSLREQRLPENICMNIFLTDDASTDGTSQAVRTNFPEVNILRGKGNSYWAGGMRIAWREALKYQSDYFLLLNDDTLLFPDAVALLLDTSANNPGERAIAVGTTCDSSGTFSYGGWCLKSAIFWGCTHCYAMDRSVECDLANGNILLVPDAVVHKIGVLADHFTHSLADFDYTLKAKKAGFSIRVSPGFSGYCLNDHKRTWIAQHSTLKERISYLKSPKGIAYHEYLRFIREHFPWSYPAQLLKLWIKVVFRFRGKWS